MSTDLSDPWTFVIWYALVGFLFVLFLSPDLRSARRSSQEFTWVVALGVALIVFALWPVVAVIRGILGNGQR